MIKIVFHNDESFFDVGNKKMKLKKKIINKEETQERICIPQLIFNFSNNKKFIKDIVQITLL
jgi:hypothetical protein